jgi:murein L,D-transpeptidase YcbB/YkuD
MPVFWTYLTAWSMGDRVVHFRNDIYLQDGIGDLALR